MTRRLGFALFFLFVAGFLSSCAVFDKTNIPPGQRVQGIGFSFEAPATSPANPSWFAVEYGTSNRIQLSQLNDEDSYSILVSVNRGPYRGMYASAESHLAAFKRYKSRPEFRRGFVETAHEEWIDSSFGDLCLRFRSTGQDRAGRAPDKPAVVDTQGLVCAHPDLNNVLVKFEITRRHELDDPSITLLTVAEALFASIEYFEIDD